jgi:hypothetical protein
MGKLTIYLDEHTENRARKAARSEGVSLSKWIASALPGAWPDFPEIHERRRRALPDARREKL